jgi:hypothetical protein
MRFRLETDPLVFAAMAALLARAWTFVRGGRLLPAGREPVTVELDDVDADHALGDAPANGRSDSRTETEPSHR